MKNILFTCLIGILAWQNQIVAQIAINTSGDAPHATAMLDITSTSKGLLMPRMTKANREAITGMATGLTVFQTDGLDGFYFYNGSKWQRLDNGNKNALINAAPSEALGLTYLGQAKTDANNSPAFRFVSDKGYFIDIDQEHQLGTSWIWYSNNDCTGTAYASAVFYGPGATFASPKDGSLFYIDQAATVVADVAVQSRYIVSSNVCQVLSPATGTYYPLTANASGTTGISLSSGTDYKVIFE